ncbi:calcium/sodium antiporter [Alkalicella caledoniensis]|uniref:Calcium/sodium antiporter n=1 Tax=Alkalicella caledoniensis TaxID=2731377 RepID=A0A7G9W9J6_ALKCA|nr:calcium/sodium antiporter [Alkalicella caledoniensis]QNO15358.1 calcium/sodium antiporter [Alkalicella caledoniensis]
MEYLLLVIGFGLLIKGADYFVVGASNIARLLRIPPILIGLTVVAFGTSAPEAAVSISAALNGSGSITLGNVIGSNIFNVSLIVGIAAMIYPLKVEKLTILKEIPLALLSATVLLVMMADRKLQNLDQNLLTRSDGLILLGFLCVFVYYIIEIALNSREKTKSEDHMLDKKNASKSVIFTFLGLVGVVLGGDIVVKNGIRIALTLGLSETLVGLTIVAIGTSLPELITSITAALRKESEIALGNIVGSNIFNTLFVLGTSSTISPVLVANEMFLDAIVMILVTLVLLLLASSNRRISKVEGLSLTIAYVIYTIYIIIRN